MLTLAIAFERRVRGYPLDGVGDPSKFLLIKALQRWGQNYILLLGGIPYFDGFCGMRTITQNIFGI